MDLKKKFANAKEQCKKHAPTIIAGISTVTAVALAITNQRLKSEYEAQLDSRCKLRGDETHVYVTADSIRRLKEGQRAIFHPIDDRDLILHMEDAKED